MLLVPLTYPPLCFLIVRYFIPAVVARLNTHGQQTTNGNTKDRVCHISAMLIYNIVWQIYNNATCFSVTASHGLNLKLGNHNRLRNNIINDYRFNCLVFKDRFIDWPFL